MASLDEAAQTSPVPEVAPTRRFIPCLFASALFLSALLIFAIQPMFTKMVLPRLGGSPQVWSVAMVVFQTALFLGYLYAHLVSRALRPGWAAIVHLVFLGVVGATLPLGIAKGFDLPPEHGVALWVAGLFFASIGLPFVALSASAPLLQHWFSVTGHKQASNPYVLYAASNLGSFAALLAYPFLIEPLFPLQTQISLWSAGFFGLAALVATAAYLAAGRTTASAAEHEESGAPPAIRQCLSWTALAAIPSGLVIAVTAYISTDLAAAPFLWVIPLALYLLTFVAVFRERPWITHATVQRLLPYAAAPLAISAFGGDQKYWFIMVALNLFVFVLVALCCHGEAYRTRPHRTRLTEFYLWIAFGGALGGVFAGLIAPNLFNNTYEYPILIAAALLLLPGMFEGGWRAFLRDAGPGLIGTAVLAVVAILFDLKALVRAEVSNYVFGGILVVLVAIMLFNARRLARYFRLIVLVLTVTRLWQPTDDQLLTTRSFFGVHQIRESPNRTHHVLMHGTTMHGAMRVRDAKGQSVTGRPEPLTYYYVGGPLSDVVAATRDARGRLAEVAIVGLGAGTLACHRRDGERWTFFEIDPAVVRIARDERYFRFLSACAPDAAIVIGDARLTLAAASGRYDLIVIDAFSSDAIPIHLLTREALRSYLSRLTPHGVMAFHVSNRHMELARVVAAVGAAEGLTAYVKRDRVKQSFVETFHASAIVVALARDAADLGDLPKREGWERIEAEGVAPWTDDYANVIGAIIRNKFGG
ncbi:MAG TPA: fused MFS/spermidine synthase [Xanthobacteraceae bacterium]|nr:fused MFS/spermidine synthase [Xanthobacteraceae bacterium]